MNAESLEHFVKHQCGNTWEFPYRGLIIEQSMKKHFFDVCFLILFSIFQQCIVLNIPFQRVVGKHFWLNFIFFLIHSQASQSSGSEATWTRVFHRGSANKPIGWNQRRKSGWRLREALLEVKKGSWERRENREEEEGKKRSGLADVGSHSFGAEQKEIFFRWSRQRESCKYWAGGESSATDSSL